VPNFAGPRQPVIIAHALDAEHILSGPVAGMSGSPVYIDGRLAGAYAYGYLWPKEQALIGITPIEQMLEILDFPPTAAVTSNGRLSGTQSNWEGLRLEPLPAPFQLSGFSRATLDIFQDQWRELGLDVVAGMGAGGGGEAKAEQWKLEPGAAVAAVIATGDFSAAATGTITYVDGDRLLGFGHPFLGLGALDMPMAGAEIITIVQSLRQSFKMSLPGPLVGTVSQDRLTGIGGKLGEVPEMTRIVVRTQPFDGQSREFEGRIWQHPQILPLFSAMSAMEGGLRTLEGQDRQTFRMKVRIQPEGLPEVRYTSVASGPMGLFPLVMDLQGNLLRLTENPFGHQRIEEVEVEIVTDPEWRIQVLREVRLLNSRVRSGEDMLVRLRVEGFREQMTELEVTIPVPAGLPRGERLFLEIADATAVDLSDGTRGAPASGVEDIVNRMNRIRSQDSIYVRLLAAATGLSVDTQQFPALPASVRAQLGHPDMHIPRKLISENVIWEQRLEVGGEFRGEYRLPITLE
jgi:hypothetical protein